MYYRPEYGISGREKVGPEYRVSSGSTIFAGTANPALAAAIGRELGVQLGACAIDRFPDGEVGGAAA